MFAFFVNNCDHTPTLEQIAKTEFRFPVLYALATHNHLTTQMQDTLKSRISDIEGSRGLSTRQLAKCLSYPAPWTFATRLDGLLSTATEESLSHNALHNGLLTLLRDYPSSKNVDRALKTITTKYHVFYGVIQDYIESHYKMEDGEDHDVWSLATIHPATLLEKLPAEQRNIILAYLYGTTTGRIQPAIPYDLPIAKLLAVGVTSILDRHEDAYDDGDFVSPLLSFTPDAIDYLIDFPKWHHCLMRQQMAPAQALHMLSVLDESDSSLLEGFLAQRRYARDMMDPMFCFPHNVYFDDEYVIPLNHDQRVKLCSIEFSLRRALEARLTSTSPRIHMETATAHALLEFLPEDSPDLLAAITAVASADHIRDYLMGHWYLRHTIHVPPTPEAVPGLVASLPKDIRVADPMFPITVDDDETSGLVEALCDHFPGAAAKLVSNPRAGAHIYASLKAADPNLNRSAAMFAAQAPFATLTAICTTVRNLDKVSA
jgi:hypothetical protein